MRFCLGLVRRARSRHGLFGLLVTGLLAPLAQASSAAEPDSWQIAQAAASELRIPSAGAERGASRVLPEPTGAIAPASPATSSVVPPTAQPPAARVGTETAAASTARASSPGGASGITQASHDLKLSITAAGRVEGLPVKEGDRVRKGELLMHLDRSLESLEVRRREVMLADNARLEELRRREKTLLEQVKSARHLFVNGGVSRKQLEDEELALGLVMAERKSIESAKQRERVELDLAREAYERRHLRSPIEGMVTRIMARVGESVAPHEPVMVVVDVRTVRFTGTISIAESARVRAGSVVQLALGAEPDAVRREARVVFVSPVADPASGLVDVIAEFDNSDGSIRPGTTGRIVEVSAGSPRAPAGR
jgi:RND family efflux transporter MFP subunit